MNALSRVHNFDELEKMLIQLPQSSGSVRHMFAPGMYIRELTIPADSYVISHKHKHAHLNLFIKGSGYMLTEDDRKIPMQAPMVFVGQPGRKVGYCKEEVVWVNIFQTDETDIDKLEEMYLDKSEIFCNAALAHEQKLLPSDDYKAFLAEVGIDESQAREISETDDVIPFPHGIYKVKIGRSGIEGKGLICTSDLEEGEFICAARIGRFRTPAGKYANHSNTPNAKMLFVDNSLVLVALRPIKGCAGGYDGEEITVDYRQVLATNLLTGPQS